MNNYIGFLFIHADLLDDNLKHSYLQRKYYILLLGIYVEENSCGPSFRGMFCLIILIILKFVLPFL